MSQEFNDKENKEKSNNASSKKLGLSSSGRLELKKTIESGTVRQSFAHGRSKSVSVEVKKVRSYKVSQNDNLDNNKINTPDKQNNNLSESEKAARLNALNNANKNKEISKDKEHVKELISNEEIKLEKMIKIKQLIKKKMFLKRLK